MYTKVKKGLCLLLACMMLMSTAACNKTSPEESPGDSTSSGGLNPSDWDNPLSTPDVQSDFQVEVPKENKTKLEDFKKINAEGVAWIQIPGTTINQEVVQAKDNEFYYRRNSKKASDFAGCLYVDMENELKTGSKTDMPQNTIIYGHNLGNPQGVTDDPNGVMFAQLLHFRDIEFAKKTPYVYLTTAGGDLVYEVFSVAYTESNPSLEDSKNIEYILPTYKNAEFLKLIGDMRDRSIFNYPDVNVTVSDKILTLSTCTYKYGSYQQNHTQRFVIMAKLVQGKNFVETAKVEENKTPRQPTFNKQRK